MTLSTTIALPGLDELSIRTLRCPPVTMVRRSNAGHAAWTLGSAPMLDTLWDRSFTFTVGDVCTPPHADVLRQVRETP